MTDFNVDFPWTIRTSQGQHTIFTPTPRRFFVNRADMYGANDTIQGEGGCVR